MFAVHYNSQKKKTITVSNKNADSSNEALASRAEKRIVFFSSFEEMEDHQLNYNASLLPEERLQNHKTLSMAAFGLKNDSQLGSTERKIKFNKEA